jgi:hypothetical protein
VALYCYFLPFFRARSLLAPFLVLFLLALLVTPGIFYAVCGAVVFGLILAIKDLVIVNRRQAYEFLVFLLSFAGFLFLYSRFAAWSAPTAFAALAAAVILWSWLVLAAPEHGAAAARAPLLLAALLLFEAGAVIFFLPLSFFSKAALLFFGSAVLYEAVVNGIARHTKQILAWGLTYAVIAFTVVFLADWKI